MFISYFHFDIFVFLGVAHSVVHGLAHGPRPRFCPHPCQVPLQSYLLAVYKNTFHACRHVAQWFTTIGAFSVVEKYLFLDLSLFPTVYKNVLLQRSSQKQKNCTFTSFTTLTLNPLKYETVTQLFFKDS